jgi:hypothetical protein
MEHSEYKGGTTVGTKLGVPLWLVRGFVIFDPAFDFLVGDCFSEGCGPSDSIVVFVAVLTPWVLAIPVGLVGR